MKLVWMLIFLSVALAGCKKESASVNDQPTSLDEISNAQNKALTNIDPIGIKSGQFVYILKTQELYSSQEPLENLIEETGMTVTEREEFGSYFDLTVIKETIDHIPEDKPHYKFKNIYSIEYPQSVASTAANSLREKKWAFAELQEKMIPFASSTLNETKVDFYNLRVVKEKINPPKKVLEHSPCAPDKDCTIEVTKLFYTVVFIPPNESSQRNEYELWLSTDVPYFATVLKSCVTGLIKVDTALPAIRQCESVYDYSFEAVTQP